MRGACRPEACTYLYCSIPSWASDSAARWIQAGQGLPMFQIHRRIQKNIDPSVVTLGDRSITISCFHLASELNMLIVLGAASCKLSQRGGTGS